MYVFNRKGTFCGFKKMNDNFFRESVFKPMMARLGIAEGKVPYGSEGNSCQFFAGFLGFRISKTRACVYTLYTIIPKTAERRISAMGESFFHLRLKPNQINERITAMISDRISVPF